MSAGLYVHIPFCKSICNYCDFYRITDLSLSAGYIDAVSKQLSTINDDIRTVYVGGGTPSVLSTELLRLLFDAISVACDVSKLSEFTIECNPEDVNQSFVDLLSEYKVSRVSLGVQSMNDKMLRYMNRRHSSKKVVSVIDLLKSNGFNNVSVDIIYGLPSIDGYSLSDDLDKFISLDVDHISAYSLSYEEKSVFTALLNKGKLLKLEDDVVYAQYLQVKAVLRSAGYDHYEISNFARNEKYSLHNTSYWQGVPYYGVGAAACGFDGRQRFNNFPDVEKYMVNSLLGYAVSEAEELSNKDKYNELVMLRLRTKFGLMLDDIKALGDEYESFFLSKVQPFLLDGSVVCFGGKYVIDEEKWFVSDLIVRELFFD